MGVDRLGSGDIAAPQSIDPVLPDNSAQAACRRREEITLLALLCLGYAGYYLCRANFSVATPMIIDEIVARGAISHDAAKVALGSIVAWGTLAYAGGKFVSGVLSDAFNGRRTFLTGMAGAILFTLLFTLGGGLPLFTLAWIGNRAIQSLGWPGLVKVSSRWFRFDRYGAIMGILSLSYLFGDAASRWFMGWLIEGGMGWRGVYCAAAGAVAVLLAANALLLRNSPGDVGLSEPAATPLQAIREREIGDAVAEGTLLELTSVDVANATKSGGVGAIVGPLLRSPAFWFVCVMSFGFTIVRETFNDWTPTFYHEALGMSEGMAAKLSALFPLLGGVSVLIAGFASDRMGRLGRPAIILGGLIFSTAFLSLMGVLPFTAGAGATAIVVLVALVGLVMIGPYSYLAGAVALDFGGKKSSGSAAGIIDGVGYLGGVLAGKTIASLSVTYGWHGAFFALAATAALSTIVAVFNLRAQSHRERLAASMTA